MPRAPLLIRSLSTADFTTAIAQHNQEIATLTVFTGGKYVTGKIGHITVLSVENLAWEVTLYKDKRVSAGAVDDDTYIGGKAFAVADAARLATTATTLAGLFRYSASGLGIDYRSPDGNIYVGLVNRSTATKTSGAGGAVIVELGFDPRP